MTPREVFLTAAAGQFRDRRNPLASDQQAIGCEHIDHGHSYVSMPLPGFRQFLEANRVLEDDGITRNQSDLLKPEVDAVVIRHTAS